MEVHIPDEKPLQVMKIDKTRELQKNMDENVIPTGARVLLRQNDSDYLQTSERVEFSLPGYNNWGLDRLNDQLGVMDGVMLDHKFDDRCFPKQGMGATIYVIDTGCRVSTNNSNPTPYQHGSIASSGEELPLFQVRATGSNKLCLA